MIFRLLYKHTSFFKRFGLPEFDIPKQVLQLVYGECLIWWVTWHSSFVIYLKHGHITKTWSTLESILWSLADQSSWGVQGHACMLPQGKAVDFNSLGTPFPGFLSHYMYMKKPDWFCEKVETDMGFMHGIYSVYTTLYVRNRQCSETCAISYFVNILFQM